MPTVTKVSALKSHDDEQQVLCVRGIVTKLYDRKAGEGTKGPWSFQNFTLKDGEDLFPVTLNNRDALPKNFKDKLVQISCRQGDKGWTGVKVKLNEYDGKDGEKVSNLVLWVTKSAEIELLDESASRPADSEPPSGPSGRQPPRTPSTDPKGTPKVLISKIANMMITCQGAALVVAKEIGIGAEEIARIDQIRTTLFIQASYDKLYFQFPPLGGKEKPPAPPPPPPPPPPAPEPPEDDNVPFN